ncbi:hypothetical protein AQUCO_00300149v1 [Aquilegia coerulea]|uniref:Uncharacterized protein n=1 Tax=Aquilegia coerulea TaxID=218851 RepID=A0A2G5EXJ4_AQUCA|nr:hypothetical protein AQUCO_00300149v1 [Aquilegia coerulea]
MVKGLEQPCTFPAIYNFGDSNLDTGGISAAFIPVPPPYGKSFPGQPAGRYCDGRLIIDFFGGSTIQQPNETITEDGPSPISLKIQLMQFLQFKARTNELYKQARSPSERGHLPNLDDYSKALYTIDIGQNDLSSGFDKMSDKELRASIPSMIDIVSLAIQCATQPKDLTVSIVRQFRSKTIWIHNTGPIGCLPAYLLSFSGGPGLLDKNGCIKSHNNIAVEFNRQLKERVLQLRTQFQDAALTYVDMYTLKYQLISDAKNQGFVEPLNICCFGQDGVHFVACGKRKNFNGTEIYGGSCANPGMYISWDGVHYSQAANYWVSNHIINGALSDPSIAQPCLIHQ